MKKFDKDPSAKLDFTTDWESEISPDTISNSIWAVPSGISMLNHTYTSYTATIWVEGGTLGEKYDCVNTIYTAAGRRDQRTSQIQIVDK